MVEENGNERGEDSSASVKVENTKGTLKVRGNERPAQVLRGRGVLIGIRWFCPV